MGRLARGPLRGPPYFKLGAGSRCERRSEGGRIVDRVAVFVDAGYLFAQGSKALCGRKLARGTVSIDHQAAIDSLANLAEEVSGMPLLRIYWYDGTSTGPTAQHNTIADLPRTKVRLGFVNSVGQQKGVDSLIVTDMITLARNRAMASCILLSGDEDIRVGVQQAQEYGVLVHVLGIKPARGSQSTFLLREADGTHEWSEDDLRPFLHCDLPPSTPEPVTVRPTPTTSLEQLGHREEGAEVDQRLLRVAQQVADEMIPSEVPSTVREIRATNQRPRELDGRLLAMSRNVMGRNLAPDEKRSVRDALLTVLEAHMTSSGDATGR